MVSSREPFDQFTYCETIHWFTRSSTLFLGLFKYFVVHLDAFVCPSYRFFMKAFSHVRSQRECACAVRKGIVYHFDIPSVKSTNLNDARIREALLRKLARQKAKPRAVLEELHVQNGGAIADVVTLHSEAHCYEIKGATDRIDRITAQGAYYNASFRRITLVTTECNLRRAMKLAPRFWGIMIAIEVGDAVRFRHVRAARLNPYFEKQAAAMTLWKSEMLELVPGAGAERKPRRLLAQLIADTRRELELSMDICDLLIGRRARVQSFASSTI